MCDAISRPSSAAWRLMAIRPTGMISKALTTWRHARSVLTGTGLTIPVGGGRLLLGTWQGLFLWEHRTAPQRRSVVVTVLGA